MKMTLDFADYTDSDFANLKKGAIAAGYEFDGDEEFRGWISDYLEGSLNDLFEDFAPLTD